MSAVTITLLAFAAEHRTARAARLTCSQACCAANDRYLLPARHSAANPPHAAAVVDQWDRHMLDRFIDPAPRTLRALSII